MYWILIRQRRKCSFMLKNKQVKNQFNALKYNNLKEKRQIKS